MSSELVWGTTIAAVGLGLIGSGYRILKHLREVRSWPTTVGRVSVSQVARADNGMWFSRVHFKYWVDGTHLTGTDISLDNVVRVAFTDWLARRAVARYPEGSEVEVHFKPDEPRIAFVELSATAAKLQLAVGIVLLTGGFLLAIVEAFS